MANRADQLTIERFPPDLRRRLRVLAAERDTTLRALLIEGAEWVVARDELPATLGQVAEAVSARRFPGK